MQTQTQEAPKVFISYKHADKDNIEQDHWVLKLATDLRRDMGVDVTLDQWDSRIGGDLPLFMEKGLSTAQLVICICSEEYVKSADLGKGENMSENMTDRQFNKILKMVSMILDGCKDLDEAKGKVKELLEEQKKEKPAE